MLSINDQFTRLPERLLCFWIGYQMLVRHRQISCLVLLLFFFGGCQKHPQAKLDFADGTYEGEINKDGQKNGIGIYRWMDGSFYEGEYQDDKRHGKGRFLWANGESYKGAYVLDERTGKGIYHWPDGSFYEGDFLSGKRHGWGQFQSTDKVVYSGEWFDDLQHGQGTLTYPDGRILKGIWRKGNLLSKPAVKPQASLKPLIPQVSHDSEEEKEKLSRPLSKTQQKMAPQSRAQQINAIPAPVQDRVTSAPETVPSVELVEPQVDSLPEDSISEEFIPPSDTGDLSEFTEEKVEKENFAKIDNTLESISPDWTGTVAEAEAMFITELIDGIDTVSDRESGIPFTGKMRILNAEGKVQGEVNLLNGRLHGDEVFYDDSGKVVETNTWFEGNLNN